MTEDCYITTPIYYVNDEPHIVTLIRPFSRMCLRVIADCRASECSS